MIMNDVLEGKKKGSCVAKIKKKREKRVVSPI